MESIHIPYKETGFFSKTIVDYLEEKKSIQQFYHRFPAIENFKAQIEEKKEIFTKENRNVLSNSLTKQYASLDVNNKVNVHIKSLKEANTFTVTTGHQLNLFSGPLYFLYKIISVLNLCKALKAKYPEQNFVPIYWMATEDHDFEEIQYFNFKGTKIVWNKKASGAVGRLSTEGLDIVFDQFSSLLNSGTKANELRALFKKSYLEHSNLATASRYLVNALFGAYGLVIVDGDDEQLKKIFKPYALKELKEQISFKKVSETNIELEKAGYKVQVNSREINLFYIGDGFRERIIKNGSGFKVNNTLLEFASAEELFEQSEKLEFVSGNALLRPLYQEVILPNLCYVGGGGELAYWMQLKSAFKAFKVPFPMLLLRNSALLVNKKQQHKAKKLQLNLSSLFLKQNKLIDNVVQKRSSIHFDFENKRKQLETTFKELEELSNKTDQSFTGAVSAQKTKQLKGLNSLEKRLLKAEKRKMKELVERITKLQNDLFPNTSLEERERNFSEYYESYGKELLNYLVKKLDPLAHKFTVLGLKDQ